jgi:hypothetical protein
MTKPLFLADSLAEGSSHSEYEVFGTLKSRLAPKRNPGLRRIVQITFLVGLCLCCGRTEASISSRDESALLLWVDIAEELFAADQGWFETLDNEEGTIPDDLAAIFSNYQVDKDEYMNLSVEVLIGLVTAGAFDYGLISSDDMDWVAELLHENKHGIRDGMKKLGFRLN